VTPSDLDTALRACSITSYSKDTMPDITVRTLGVPYPLVEALAARPHTRGSG
jgi:hypothetical protein